MCYNGNMTTTQKFTREDLREMAYEAEVDVKFTDSYSGRFMYGQRCFGIEGSHAEIMAFLLKLAFTAGEASGAGYENSTERDLFELLDQSSSNTDSMGRDQIMYWPSVQVEIEGDDEDDDY